MAFRYSETPRGCGGGGGGRMGWVHFAITYLKEKGGGGGCRGGGGLGIDCRSHRV